MRKILKNTLQKLAIKAIEKHDIKFIVIAGWYGTELVKEGIYSALSEKIKMRRNTRRIWWDFSIPLVILGYEDRQYNILGWVVVILKSIFVLYFGKKNPQRIILNINLGGSDTAEYWSQIISPEVLIVTSYKSGKNVFIEKLIEKTHEVKGEVLVSKKIEDKIFKDCPKYSYDPTQEKQIITPNRTYGVNPNIPKLVIENYAPIVALTEILGWSEKEIVNALAKFDATEEITRKIVRSI